MSQSNNKSQVLLKNPQKQQFNQFYKLHYFPNKKPEDSSPGFPAFRSKSVIYNTHLGYQNQSNLLSKQKQPSNIEKKIKQKINKKQKSKEKTVKQKPKFNKISFHKVLSSQSKKQDIELYFNKSSQKQIQNQLDEYCKQNIEIKMAVQKCKDQKVKIKKVISSIKQSQETKMDYLELKKKDIDDEIFKEMKIIYEQFFKKQYQELYGSKGFLQFQQKMKITIDVLHSHMFQNR